MLGVFCKSSNLDVNVCVCVLTYEIEFCRIFPPIYANTTTITKAMKKENRLCHTHDTHTFVAKFLYACLFGHKNGSHENSLIQHCIYIVHILHEIILLRV